MIGECLQREVVSFDGTEHLPQTSARKVAPADPMTSSAGYVPSPVEKYLLDNAAALGYDTKGKDNAKGCTIWKEEGSTPFYDKLQQYQQELTEYKKRVTEFQPKYPDLRLAFDTEDQEKVCKSVELHPDGLPGIFHSGLLSFTSSGYVEPLTTPMRDPAYCFKGYKKIFSLDYLVHDFRQMCRKLKRTSRIVLFDMGASLKFDKAQSPAIYLTEIFDKFGFQFDHVYAFEVKKTDPVSVFKKVPQRLLPAYHWMNVGVSSIEGDRLNPFTMLKERFNEDDLIIVKLDIDTSSIEVPLAYQLLNDPSLGKLVDQFYFEHHVHLKELARNWLRSMNGSVKESLDLFAGLRKNNVAAHFWP